MPVPDLSQLTIISTSSLQDTSDIAGSLLRAAASAGLGVFVWDLQAGRLLWNESMYALYGLDPQQFDGSVSGWLATLHPDDLPRIRDDVRAAVLGERGYDTQFRVRDLAGGWRYLKGTAWVERDAANKPVRMAGFNQDITASARFQALLDELQQTTDAKVGQSYFDALVAAIAHGMGVRYAFVAEAFPREQPTHARVIAMFADGKPGGELEYSLTGTPCATVVSNEPCLYACDVQRLFPDDQLLRDMNVQAYLGVPLLSSRGQVLGMLVVLHDHPLSDSEAMRSLLALFAGRAGAELERLQREAEIQRLNAELENRVAMRTEELRRTMRELEAFTYTVSHDLNAPLRAIQGFGTILHEDYARQLDATGLDYLQRSLGAAERMGRLLDDLVSLSKISLRPLGVGKVHLSEMAGQIVADLQASQPRPGLQFELPAPLVVHADPGLMHILLDCLLRTAWQFLAHTEAPRLRLYERQHQGRREIVLQDNGAGFDVQAVERLFSPFQNLNSQGGLTGSGTGLAIAQRIVLRHHGGIAAESRLGEGASFRFWLPPAAELMALLAEDPL